MFTTSLVTFWWRIRCAISGLRIRRMPCPVLRDVLRFAISLLQFDLSDPVRALTLAVGWSLFGSPWAGVLLSTAAFCSLCYWMLRGWTTPSWALLGGVLAVFEFGPLQPVDELVLGSSGYSAAAGCLVFGALPRLRRARRARDAVLLGLGLAMHLLSRPFESIFLVLSVVLFLLPDFGKLARPALITALVCLPALGIVLLQNKQVTGSG